MRYNKPNRELYLKPTADTFILSSSMNLLATLSVEGTIDDFTDGGEL